jgi:hypothetical protein
MALEILASKSVLIWPLPWSVCSNISDLSGASLCNVRSVLPRAFWLWDPDAKDQVTYRDNCLPTPMAICGPWRDRGIVNAPSCTILGLTKVVDTHDNTQGGLPVFHQPNMWKTSGSNLQCTPHFWAGKDLKTLKIFSSWWSGLHDEHSSNMWSICIDSYSTRLSHILRMCGQSIYDDHLKYVLNVKQGRTPKKLKMRAVYDHDVSSCTCFIMCTTYIQCLGQSNSLKTFE